MFSTPVPLLSKINYHIFGLGNSENLLRGVFLGLVWFCFSIFIYCFPLTMKEWLNFMV